MVAGFSFPRWINGKVGVKITREETSSYHLVIKRQWEGQGVEVL